MRINLIFVFSFSPEASICLRALSLPASVCPSVRPSVTKFVCAITHHMFKLGSPSLDHRCKRPWLRSLLFWLTLPLKTKLNFKVKFTPFGACLRYNSSPVKAWATKFRPKLLSTLVKIPIVLGVDWAWHVKFNLFSNPVYLHRFCVFEIFVRPAKKDENGVCSTS